MQVGIIGLPFSGKSTLFTTLLSQKSASGEFRSKHQAEKGVIKIQDNRLDKLTAMFNPKSKVNATVEYIKVPGFDSNSESGMSAQFLANVKTVDEILLVVRAFENELYPHPLNRVDPKADIQYVTSELLLSDLVIIENRLEKLEKQIKKIKDENDIKEKNLLEKCKIILERNQSLRDASFSKEEVKLLRGFQFLTAKPMLIVLNIEEKDLKNAESYVQQYEYPDSGNVSVVPLCLKVEQEISELDPEDREMFMAELGIQESALFRLVHRSYEQLGLMIFFTVGEDECRSWTIRKGTNAQKAAGAIHSDLERGFIRAEVVSYADLVQHGSLPACRAKGLVRLEGKDYIVQDGDIMEIRFNV